MSEEDIHGIIDSNKLKEEYHAIVENLKHEYIHNLALRSSTGNIIGPGTGLQIRVRIGKLFSLFLIQNICCGYSKELSQ